MSKIRMLGIPEAKEYDYICTNLAKITICNFTLGFWTFVSQMVFTIMGFVHYAKTKYRWLFAYGTMFWFSYIIIGAFIIGVDKETGKPAIETRSNQITIVIFVLTDCALTFWGIYEFFNHDFENDDWAKTLVGVMSFQSLAIGFFLSACWGFRTLWVRSLNKIEDCKTFEEGDDVPVGEEVKV